MYKAFKIKINEIEKLSENIKRAKKILNDSLYKPSKNYMYMEMYKKINKEGLIQSVIDGSKLETSWFPTEELDKFNVFISHSHKDKELIEDFAKLLEEELDLRCFIDLKHWGYINDLLKEIDDRYCKGDSGKYDYDKRNVTTANVHVLFSMALMKMMNQTECIIFVDSDNSIDNGTTLSPWIYEELCFINMLQERPRSSKQLLIEGIKKISELKFKFKVDMDYLKELQAEVFYNAIRDNKKNTIALDYIYKYTDSGSDSGSSKRLLCD